ncbi:hypothetical protein SAMN05216338_100262 [Bradyrhizobium sp. Rc2d]|nr:hypothetical protein SAMN05216338_100262 [Bradyrhizobium sp. Rc2d]
MQPKVLIPALNVARCLGYNRFALHALPPT